MVATHPVCLALTYQHGGPEVELLSQLGDVDVHRHQVLLVILLHLPDDVSQPLKLPLGPCHPDEVDLGTHGWSLGPSSGQATYIPGISTLVELFWSWPTCALPQTAWGDGVNGGATGPGSGAGGGVAPGHGEVQVSDSLGH